MSMSAIRDQRKMTEVASESKTSLFIFLTGDDLNRNAGNSYGLGLNIRHGHGATVVVRGR